MTNFLAGIRKYTDDHNEVINKRRIVYNFFLFVYFQSFYSQSFPCSLSVYVRWLGFAKIRAMAFCEKSGSDIGLIQYPYELYLTSERRLCV